MSETKKWKGPSRTDVVVKVSQKKMTVSFETNKRAVQEYILSYLVGVGMGQMRAGVHQLYCTDSEEVESDTHLAVTYQKVRQILQKNELCLSYSAPYWIRL